MELKIGYSYSNIAMTAVNEACKDFREPETIMFFSPLLLFEDINRMLSLRYPDCVIIGSTTMIAFFEGRFFSEDKDTPGTVVVSMGRSYECVAGLIENIKDRPMLAKNEIRRTASRLRSREDNVCICFNSAYMVAEELVLDTFSEALRDFSIPVVGSSAGNENWETQTRLAYNGRVYDNACVYLMIHNRLGRIHIYKENMFKPTRNMFTATSVDINNRIVYELDGMPAAQAYAKALHVDMSELSEYWDSHPIGRIEGDDINVAEVTGITEENGLQILSTVFGGTKVSILEQSNFSDCMAEFVAKIRSKVPRPSFVFYINCMSLTRLYKENDWLPVFGYELGTVADDFAGMSGYGEQFGRTNLNKSLLAIVFE